MADPGAWAIRAAASAALGAALAGCAAGGASTTITDARDLERGRALYDNNCRACHTARVHRRVPRLPMNEDELRRIVLTWVRFEGMRWSGEDVDDVVYYVNRTYYRFDR
jgi:mono/diheme cytochrome c family protein